MKTKIITLVLGFTALCSSLFLLSVCFITMLDMDSNHQWDYYRDQKNSTLNYVVQTVIIQDTSDSTASMNEGDAENYESTMPGDPRNCWVTLFFVIQAFIWVTLNGISLPNIDFEGSDEVSKCLLTAATLIIIWNALLIWGMWIVSKGDFYNYIHYVS